MDEIDQSEKTSYSALRKLHAPHPGLDQSDEASPDPIYCVRVTANDGALGDQYLREFQDNEKTIPTDPYHIAKAFHRSRCP